MEVAKAEETIGLDADSVQQLKWQLQEEGDTHFDYKLANWNFLLFGYFMYYANVTTMVSLEMDKKVNRIGLKWNRTL